MCKRNPPASSSGPGDFLFAFGLLFHRVNADALAVAALTLKLDVAVDESKQSVVGAAAHILTGMDVGSALLHQNVAGQHELSVGALTPRRLDSESRPFLVEPIPFL